MWKLWAKAMGEKACSDDREADIVAYIRTAIMFIYLVANFFLIAGVIKHW